MPEPSPSQPDLEQLRELQLFEDLLDFEQYAPRLLKVGTPVHFDQGQVLLLKDDYAQHFDIVLSGKASAELPTKRGKILVGELEAGSWFGLRGVHPKRQRPARATVTVKSPQGLDSLRISRDDFGEIYEEWKALKSRLDHEDHARQPFDEMIFDLDLFKKLKPKEQLLLSRHARYRVVSTGEVLTHQGEYQPPGLGLFWVVLSGSISVNRQNRDGSRKLLETLTAGGWFGEVNAMSDRPSQATLRADVPSTVLEISAPLFKDLQKNKHFADTVETSYRERSLVIHLLVVPMFAELSDRERARLKDRVEFEHHPKNSLLAQQGEPIHALYLVRSGAVKSRVQDPIRGEVIRAYFMSNSSFGDSAILDPPPKWSGDYITMTDTSILKVSPEALRTLENRSVEAMTEYALGLDEETDWALTQTVVAPPRGESGPSKSQELEVMVRYESVKGGEALAIDLELCIRCNACVESCVAVHDDRVPRLSKTGYRVSETVTLATACYNCEIPGCMLACPHGAIRRDVRGLINFVYDNCVGCTACTTGCPYDVISMTPPPETGTEPKFKRHWFLSTLPFVGKRFRGNRPITSGDRGEAVLTSGYSGAKVTAKAIKCDLCEGLPFEACVYNCPTDAIYRIAPSELVARANRSEGARDGL